MEEVIHYLELKNEFYEKFQSLTEKFLGKIKRDEWQDFDYFVDNRERILSILHSFDCKIAESFDKVDMGAVDLELYRPRVRELLSQRDLIGKKILALDLQLIGLLDTMKSETIRDLKQTLETHNQLQSFSTLQSPKKISRGA